MRCIGAVAPSPALCASSCIFSGCGNTALTKPRLNEPSRGALDGVAPRQQMSSSPSRDAGTIEGGTRRGGSVHISRLAHRVGFGAHGSSAGRGPTHPSPPPQPLCRFPRSQDERVPSGGALVGTAPCPHRPRPRALPRGAEGVRAAPQNPSHLLPLCAVGFGDTCERYPVQSRAALCAPLPVSGCHSTSAAVFVWKPPSRWGLGYGWGPLRGEALLPDPAQPEPGEPAGAATPPSLAFPSCSVPTLPRESVSTPRKARRDP